MEHSDRPPDFTAFRNGRRLASGALVDVALSIRQRQDEDQTPQGYHCFDDRTGAWIDLDLSGSESDIVARLAPEPEKAEPKPPKVGRPKLGVVAREVTLLPRHWDWLGKQPGGASAAMRRLVEAARKTNAGEDELRRAKAAADRFMMAMLGEQPGYEDAARALYAGDGAAFNARIADWPEDLKAYVKMLAGPVFAHRPTVPGD